MYGCFFRWQPFSFNRKSQRTGFHPEHSLMRRNPALYRLEHQGLIASEWGESEHKRKAKYYRLTAAGRRQLQQEARNWNRMADIIAGILNTAPEEL
jgi:DNA-binding PadR family transcriptional regulator